MMNFLTIEETRMGTNYEFKQIRYTETYVSRLGHRPYRRVMTLFSAGSLLSIETGRYARPPVPVENRLCVVCNENCVESEKHFLLDCPLYDDLRLILFLQCSVY